VQTATELGQLKTAAAGFEGRIEAARVYSERLSGENTALLEQLARREASLTTLQNAAASKDGKVINTVITQLRGDLEAKNIDLEANAREFRRLSAARDALGARVVVLNVVNEDAAKFFNTQEVLSFQEASEKYCKMYEFDINFGKDNR
jgi:hypothetical protein